MSAGETGIMRTESLGRSYLVRPDGPGPFPGVVVIHEASGLNDNIRDICGRFAAEGYAALGVDLFEGRHRAVCMARMFAGGMAGNLDYYGVPALKDALGQLASRPEVDAERGVILGGEPVADVADVVVQPGGLVDDNHARKRASAIWDNQIGGVQGFGSHHRSLTRWAFVLSGPIVLSRRGQMSLVCQASPLIRSHGQTVQNRPGPSPCVGSWLWSWQQFRQQSRTWARQGCRSRADRPRVSCPGRHGRKLGLVFA